MSKKKMFAAGIILCAMSVIYGFTINGSQAPARLLGVPLGGIGAGVFNFLPNGTYSRQYCQTVPATGMEPTIMVYTKKGTTEWSSEALTTANGIGISYTGYWPKVINKYSHSSLTIDLTLEAFSPINPGDNKSNSMPMVFYVFTLENKTSESITASIALKNNANQSVIKDGSVVKGIEGNNITVMVVRDDNATVTSGSTISDFTDDGLLSDAVGGIIASQVMVAPSETKTITFVIAWECPGYPVTQESGPTPYYETWYKTSREVAQYGYDSSTVLKNRVDNWHNKILNSSLPEWYKDVLINNCHVMNSMYTWSIDSDADGGHVMMRESMSSAGAHSCFDQRYYSSIIVPIFSPDVEYLEMGEFAEDQAGDGQIPHGTNGNSGDKSDINSEFALCLLRDYMWTGEQRFLENLYENAKKALIKNRNWDTDQDGLTDGVYSTFDQPMYDGWMPVESEYCGDIWLAAIKAGKNLALLSGDSAMAKDCDDWFSQTSQSFEKLNGAHGFWNNTTPGPTGKRGYYTGSNDLTSQDGKGIACWASQLGGQWYADFLQLGLLHPQERIDSAIQYIEALNKGERGYYLAILPDKTNWFGKWPGSNRCGEQWPWFPPSHFGGPAIANGFADIGLDCIHRQWRANYSDEKLGPMVWSSPVFQMVDGSDADDTWGRYRYMNPPGVFSTLFSITGFSIDVANKTLWIKPNLPTSFNKKLDKAPLINPKSCGTLSYEDYSPSFGQKIELAFDNYMNFETIIIRDPDPTFDDYSLEVWKNGVPIPCNITRSGSGKRAEMALFFISGGIMIGPEGTEITLKSATPINNIIPNVPGINKVMTFKSLNLNNIKYLRQYDKNNSIEIFDLRGKTVYRGTVNQILQNKNVKISRGVHIYRIKPLEK